MFLSETSFTQDNGWVIGDENKMSLENKHDFENVEDRNGDFSHSWNAWGHDTPWEVGKSYGPPRKLGDGEDANSIHLLVMLFRRSG